MKRVWLLNLEAEVELANPRGYTTPLRVQRRVAGLQQQVLAELGPGDITLEQLLQARAQAPRAGRSKPARRREQGEADLVGIAWCPTPSAVRRFEAASVSPPAAPAIEVLQRVNHRAFCSQLCPTLDGAAFVTSRAQLDTVMAASQPALGWLLKRPFSVSGSGRRSLHAITSEADEGWVAASFRVDGLQVEPLVERLLDICVHGFVAASGRITLGSPLRQQCDRYGRWSGSDQLPAADGLMTAEWRDRLRAELERVAAALLAADYFGPFGIDAFVYRDGDRIRFHPCCEINARYTMSWATGMGQRPDLSR